LGESGCDSIKVVKASVKAGYGVKPFSVKSLVMEVTALINTHDGLVGISEVKCGKRFGRGYKV